MVSPGEDSVATHELSIQLVPTSGPDESGCGNASAYAVVQRHALDPTGQCDESVGVQTLLNPLTSVENGAINAIAQTLVRLDSLSHVLFWTSQADYEQLNPQLLLIELPRVGLTFTPQMESGRCVLGCHEHGGLFVSPQASDYTKSLITGIPQTIVLQDSVQREHVVMAATVMPQCPELSSALFSTQMVLNRRHQPWIDNLKKIRHYTYPVHVSGMYLSTPTLPSTLYLLIMKLVSRQYKDAFRLIDLCSSDIPLSAEENQIWDCLKSLGHDVAPDMHACRLKICLAVSTARGSECVPNLPFNMTNELSQYVEKRAAVSAYCRLSVDDELELLSQVGNDLSNHLVLSNHALILGSDNPALQLSGRECKLSLPAAPHITNYDSVVDRHAVDGGIGGNLELKASLLLDYSLPVGYGVATRTNVLSIRFFNSCLSGEHPRAELLDKLGFLGIYELLTGGIDVRVMDTDTNSHTIGKFLVRIIDDNNSSGSLMSILRILAANPDLAAAAPKFSEAKAKVTSSLGGNMFSSALGKFANAVKGTDASSILEDDCREYLQGQSRNIQWPGVQFPLADLYKCSKKIQVPPLSEVRLLLVPRASDLSCGKQLLKSAGQTTDADVAAFVSSPIHPSILGLNSFSAQLSRTQQGLGPVNPELPFDLEKHPSAASEIAQQMASRLAADCQFFAQQENSGHSLALQLGPVVVESKQITKPNISQLLQHANTLLAALEAQEKSDRAAASADERAAVNIANRTTAQGLSGEQLVHRHGFSLQQLCGEETDIDAMLLSMLVLSEEGRNTLAKLNPYLDSAAVDEVFCMMCTVMLRFNRVSQIARCIELTRSMSQLLTKLDAAPQIPPDAPFTLQLQADLLVGSLCSRRAYVETGPEGTFCDPRFLIFEFCTGFLLRSSQVELVRRFVTAVNVDDTSLCHQMIMGAGKTTVVAPLLHMILGNGSKLMLQVMPKALLPFSRQVMREAFGPLVRKSVLTFHFSRASSVSHQLVRKLEWAAQSSAVVCSTPASIKSLVLKFVELMHELGHLRGHKADVQEERSSSLFNRVRGKVTDVVTHVGADVGLLKRSTSAATAIDLHGEAALYTHLLSILRQGTLLLDEVDLILHPLKSELNWPLGSKNPLDFTLREVRHKGTVRTGMRWLLPWHMLDAIFFVETGRMSVGFSQSGQATKLLTELKQVIDTAIQLNQAQANPHIVLLNRDFYDAELLPRLGKWLLLFIRAEGLVASDLSNEDALEYLMQGPGSSAFGKVQQLPDTHIKMLNLSHSWLTTLAFHILSKIDRVFFGLLDEELVEAEPLMPKSRKMLAVPFVGERASNIRCCI